MNITKRLVLGFASSALLAVGLARAADLFDPMSQSLNGGKLQASLKGSPDSSGMCVVDSPPLKGAAENTNMPGMAENLS